MELVIPRRIKYIKEELSVDIFGSTKNLMEIVKKCKVMREYDISELRSNIFAKNIHKDNEFESIQLHQTYISNDQDHICIVHVDNKNRKELQMVVLWSTMVKQDGIYKRIRMVGYWRYSIDQYLQQRNIDGNYLLLARNILENLDTERYRFINLNLMLKDEVLGFEGKL